MIYTTTDTIPGKEIAEVRGVVTGNVVQSKHIGRDLMAGLKSIVGGEIRGYTEMMTEARDIAIQRMVEQANQKGADAIVGIRFTTSSIVDGSSEILAFDWRGNIGSSPSLDSPSSGLSKPWLHSKMLKNSNSNPRALLV